MAENGDDTRASKYSSSLIGTRLAVDNQTRFSASEQPEGLAEAVSGISHGQDTD